MNSTSTTPVKPSATHLTITDEEDVLRNDRMITRARLALKDQQEEMMRKPFTPPVKTRPPTPNSRIELVPSPTSSSPNLLSHKAHILVDSLRHRHSEVQMILSFLSASNDLDLVTQAKEALASARQVALLLIGVLDEMVLKEASKQSWKEVKPNDVLSNLCAVSDMEDVVNLRADIVSCRRKCSAM